MITKIDIITTDDDRNDVVMQIDIPTDTDIITDIDCIDRKIDNIAEMDPDTGDKEDEEDEDDIGGGLNTLESSES